MLDAVVQALAELPQKRDALNAVDDKILGAIQRIETALTELRACIRAETRYDTEEGRFILSFGKHQGTWHLMWGCEKDDDIDRDVPLAHAPRHARGDVFSPNAQRSLSPVACLIVEIGHALVRAHQERHVLVTVAERIVAVLEDAVAAQPKR